MIEVPYELRDLELAGIVYLNEDRINIGRGRPPTTLPTGKVLSPLSGEDIVRLCSEGPINILEVVIKDEKIVSANILAEMRFSN